MEEDDLISFYLKEWQVEPLLSLFRVNHITSSLFWEMTPEMISELMRDVPLGIRWTFIKNYSVLKDSVKETQSGMVKPNSEQAESQSPILTVARNVSDDSQSGAVDIIDYSFDPDDFLHDVNQNNLEDRSVTSNSEDLPLSELAKTQARKTPENKTLDCNFSSLQYPTVPSNPSNCSSSRPLVDANHRANKRVAVNDAQKEIHNLDLKQLLENSIDGKAILQVYTDHGFLEDEDRSVLSEIVSKWLLFRLHEPKRCEFEVLRDKVLALFPSEENVYYIPPLDEGPHQVLARGKIFDKVRNLKEWMRRKNLLPQKTKKSKGDKSITCKPTGGAVELTEEVKTALEWLKARREPWQQVIEKWGMTSAYRLSVLKSSDGKISDYTEMYKHLKLTLGHTLIEMDFRQLYPTKQDALVCAWPDFRDKMLVVLRDPSCVKDSLSKEIQENLSTSKGDDAINIAILQCLPSLIVPSRQVLLGKKKIKPSVQESRDAFVLHVKLPSDVQPSMDRRQQRMMSYGEGATVQPYIMFVGPGSRTEVSAIYVVIDKFMYKLDSVLHALDVCFKSFMALNACYPAEAEHLWLLVQKALYGIETPYDKNIFNVTSFIRKLHKIEA